MSRAVGGDEGRGGAAATTTSAIPRKTAKDLEASEGRHRAKITEAEVIRLAQLQNVIRRTVALSHQQQREALEFRAEPLQRFLVTKGEVEARTAAANLFAFSTTFLQSVASVVSADGGGNVAEAKFNGGEEEKEAASGASAFEEEDVGQYASAISFVPPQSPLRHSSSRASPSPRRNAGNSSSSPYHHSSPRLSTANTLRNFARSNNEDTFDEIRQSNAFVADVMHSLVMSQQNLKNAASSASNVSPSGTADNSAFLQIVARNLSDTMASLLLQIENSGRLQVSLEESEGRNALLLSHHHRSRLLYISQSPPQNQNASPANANDGCGASPHRIHPARLMPPVVDASDSSVPPPSSTIVVGADDEALVNFHMSIANGLVRLIFEEDRRRIMFQKLENIAFNRLFVHDWALMRDAIRERERIASRLMRNKAAAAAGMLLLNTGTMDDAADGGGGDASEEGATANGINTNNTNEGDGEKPTGGGNTADPSTNVFGASAAGRNRSRKAVLLPPSDNEEGDDEKRGMPASPTNNNNTNIPNGKNNNNNKSNNASPFASQIRNRNISVFSFASASSQQQWSSRRKIINENHSYAGVVGGALSEVLPLECNPEDDDGIPSMAFFCSASRHGSLPPLFLHCPSASFMPGGGGGVGGGDIDDAVSADGAVVAPFGGGRSASVSAAMGPSSYPLVDNPLHSGAPSPLPPPSQSLPPSASMASFTSILRSPQHSFVRRRRLNEEYALLLKAQYGGVGVGAVAEGRGPTSDSNEAEKRSAQTHSHTRRRGASSFGDCGAGGGPRRRGVSQGPYSPLSAGAYISDADDKWRRDSGEEEDDEPPSATTEIAAEPFTLAFYTYALRGPRIDTSGAAPASADGPGACVCHHPNTGNPLSEGKVNTKDDKNNTKNDENINSDVSFQLRSRILRENVEVRHLGAGLYWCVLTLRPQPQPQPSHTASANAKNHEAPFEGRSVVSVCTTCGGAKRTTTVSGTAAEGGGDASEEEKQQRWFFYSDNAALEFHVEMVSAGPAADLWPLGTTVATKSTDPSHQQQQQQRSFSTVVYPGETAPFWEGVTNGYKSNFSSKPLSEAYMKATEEALEATVARQLATIATASAAASAANGNEKEDTKNSSDSPSAMSEAFLRACLRTGVPFVDPSFVPIHRFSLHRCGLDRFAMGVGARAQWEALDELATTPTVFNNHTNKAALLSSLSAIVVPAREGSSSSSLLSSAKGNGIAVDLPQLKHTRALLDAVYRRAEANHSSNGGDDEQPNLLEQLVSALPEPSPIFSSSSVAPTAWMRPSEFLSPPFVPHIVTFRTVEPSDMDQGKLGDCWLLAAVASLAEFPVRIERLFGHHSPFYKGGSQRRRQQHALGSRPIPQRISYVDPSSHLHDGGKSDGPSPTTDGVLLSRADAETVRANRAARKAEEALGAYRITLNINGWWRTILIDDYLPTVGAVPCFARNREDPAELWPSLIEKAFAKAYGSYSAIWSGDAHRSLPALSGFPTVSLSKGLEEACFDLRKSDAFFTEELIRRRRRGHAAVLSTRDFTPEDAPAFEAVGLTMSHSYSLIDVAHFPHHNNLQLCKIRNPWGNGTEWTGEWSDKCPNWSNPKFRDVAEQLRPAVADDGTFWMSFAAVKEYFDDLVVCPYEEGWHDHRVKGAFMKRSILLDTPPNTGTATISMITGARHERKQRTVVGTNVVFVVRVYAASTAQQERTHTSSVIDSSVNPSSSPSSSSVETYITLSQPDERFLRTGMDFFNPSATEEDVEEDEKEDCSRNGDGDLRGMMTDVSCVSTLLTVCKMRAPPPSQRKAAVGSSRDDVCLSCASAVRKTAKMVNNNRENDGSETNSEQRWFGEEQLIGATFDVVANSTLDPDAPELLCSSSASAAASSSGPLLFHPAANDALRFTFEAPPSPSPPPPKSATTSPSIVGITTNHHHAMRCSGCGNEVKREEEEGIEGTHFNTYLVVPRILDDDDDGDEEFAAARDDVPHQSTGNQREMSNRSQQRVRSFVLGILTNVPLSPPSSAASTSNSATTSSVSTNEGPSTSARVTVHMASIDPLCRIFTHNADTFTYAPDNHTCSSVRGGGAAAVSVSSVSDANSSTTCARVRRRIGDSGGFSYQIMRPSVPTQLLAAAASSSSTAAESGGRSQLRSSQHLWTHLTPPIVSKKGFTIV